MGEEVMRTHSTCMKFFNMELEIQVEAIFHLTIV